MVAALFICCCWCWWCWWCCHQVSSSSSSSSSRHCYSPPVTGSIFAFDLPNRHQGAPTGWPSGGSCDVRTGWVNGDDRSLPADTSCLSTARLCPSHLPRADGCSTTSRTWHRDREGRGVANQPAEDGRCRRHDHDNTAIAMICQFLLSVLFEPIFSFVFVFLIKPQES